ncbi:MAG: acetyl-CoA carboxylase biotin carboxyl carrier protein [Candidatus Wallbacteria bacterium HGW-Wallbacteria-1]|jgi:acetyl-CoA carboxylase biotin carboxyl carrier protein|uniref:Biotin carboxyl carrier protein of acetyl-CoA carboxylase n=1 Tax=Candidatus Wallbacteria bacterium HGW-Wallbacteria-1 TaxID=2013854 RepID=A0A2N1PT86_9BACT|nr:MAG: acetyl-CoA carboxylase biotin carboxyl carrier protein [Candidatus Wallbacteria bacterium HGW-Wallbacteria-1]
MNEQAVIEDRNSGSWLKALETARNIVNLVDEHDLEELTLQEPGMRIKACRAPHETGGSSVIYSNIGQQSQISPFQFFNQTAGMADSAVDLPSSPSVSEPAPDESKLIKSPIAGTFYRSPSPGAKPFVEEGQSISSGTALCIVEAMKLMNEIKADKSGRIREICLDDATPVRVGEILFILE